ncbi:hypothetical protein SAMN05421812_109188 [Asanoa hainanensis]|uniref:Uncharacterized protein n=1 Tax=Asanoa hainanensis TaxID=560556 RepID=A0A239NKU6_9ACTN|nr:hypothetical protein [Asanoa hainanensis]SNT55212.1 hypothetical protein SAMN05421812_109188 [Asanoa hainanensis]
MSFDLYFWPAGATKRPQQLADRLAEENTRGLVPDARVLAFRAELLRRWPELDGRIEPEHEEARYVVLTLAFGWPAISALPVLARAHQLDCYDPQVGRLAVAPAAVGLEGASTLEGRVLAHHLVRALRQISAYIGYRYDDLDEEALTGALDDTDDEAGPWFDYPLAGTPALTIFLARSQGGSAVSIRVEGLMNLVLSARIDTVLDVY